MSLVQRISRVRPGNCDAIRRVELKALMAARVEVNVLITGERGVGKAVVARYIHEHSNRSAHGFAVLKCDRLSDELVRAELFGHAGGTAAGGSLDRPWLLTSTFRGTVYLDEVGALGAGTQARLLRYLDAAERRPVRLIASTSINLASHVAAGLFRPDLFNRLSAVTLMVPPPHEQRDNMPSIAGYIDRRTERLRRR